MSYDLWFYQRAGRNIFQRGDPPLTQERLVAWGIAAKGRYPGLSAHATATGVETLYHNPDTGVDFHISYSSGRQANGDQATPRGVRPAGLSFNINYVRPSFYAREAMPIVVEMAESLSLLAVNPQDSEAPTTPQPCNVDRLIATWDSGNKQALKIARGMQQPLPRMAPETSLAWWQYMSQKGRLERQVGSAIFAPHLFFLYPRDKPPAEQTLYTSVVWTSGDPIILPKLEYIALPLKAGYVAAGPVMQALTPYLEPLANPLNADIKVLRPGHEGDVQQIYDALTVEQPLSAFGMIRDVDIMFDDTGDE